MTPAWMNFGWMVLGLIGLACVVLGTIMVFFNRPKHKTPSTEIARMPSVVPGLLRAAVLAEPVINQMAKMKVSAEKKEIDRYFEEKLREYLITHREEIRRLL